MNMFANIHNLINLWFPPEMEQTCHVVPHQLLVGPHQAHVALLPQALHQDSSLDLQTAAQKSPTMAKITIWSGQFFFQPIQVCLLYCFISVSLMTQT